jgi:hypothetical protein
LNARALLQAARAKAEELMQAAIEGELAAKAALDDEAGRFEAEGAGVAAEREKLAGERDALEAMRIDFEQELQARPAPLPVTLPCCCCHGGFSHDVLSTALHHSCAASALIGGTRVACRRHRQRSRARRTHCRAPRSACARRSRSRSKSSSRVRPQRSLFLQKRCVQTI